MATVTKPIALDESIKTTESTSRNIADVLAQELSGIASAITGGDNKANKTDIATVEPTNTASRAYSVGELVYVNGNLYKVITAIASGATFTVGTNIQSTNVSGTVKDALDKKLALLWENSNPSTTFAAQNIDVTCGKIFKSFLVEFRYYYNSTNMISPSTCAVGYGGMALFFGISGSGRVSSLQRDVTPSELSDGYRFAFTGCGVKDLTTYGSAPSTSTDNNWLIPLRIWGIG